MKKACLVVPPACQNNKIFDLSDGNINRDGCMVPFVKLKERFAVAGFLLATDDINRIPESDCIIYLEMPDELPSEEQKGRSNLLLFETELILPENWNKAKHERFSRIFTWNDAFVDNQKYFKTNWSHVFPERINYDWQLKTAFCCVISGNKTSSHPLELYSKRVEAIRWFEKNHPECFDLYGTGWNQFRFRGSHFLERFQPLRALVRFLSFLGEKYPSYRGKISNKFETLQKYKFSICYENARDIPGYITEKIFDCFFAGCVPVYWGANNIQDLIPSDCFIDRRNFKSYDELFKFMIEMSPKTHENYVLAAQNYLSSAAARIFSADYFAETIVKHSVSQSLTNLKKAGR